MQSHSEVLELGLQHTNWEGGAQLAPNSCVQNFQSAQSEEKGTFLEEKGRAVD